MTKPKLVPEISWGHIFTGIVLVSTVVSLHFGTEAKIAAEAHAREQSDSSLQAQAAENTRAIQRNIDSIEKLDGWKDQHQSDWDVHLGEYGVEHK